MSLAARTQQDLLVPGHAIRHFMVSNVVAVEPPAQCLCRAPCRYHSHFSAQYGNGIVGTIQINGPASADYDIDLGTYPISDWYHKTADLLALRVDVN